MFISNVDRGPYDGWASPSSQLGRTHHSHGSADLLRPSAALLCRRWKTIAFPSQKGFLVFQLHFKILIETQQLYTYFYLHFC